MHKIITATAIGIAAIGILVGTTTGAVADRLIGSNDVANNSLRGVDVHNGTLGLPDLNDHTRALVTAHPKAGTAGHDGADGTDGTNGHDGTNGRDGIDGAPGAPGAAGAPGADGKDGVDGKDGADGVSGYYVRNVTVAIAAGSSATADVTCEEGTYALGGGVTAPADTRGYGTEADLVTNVAGPIYAATPTGDGADGWHVVVTNTNHAHDLAALAWVECAALN